MPVFQVFCWLFIVHGFLLLWLDPEIAYTTLQITRDEAISARIDVEDIHKLGMALDYVLCRGEGVCPDV